MEQIKLWRGGNAFRQVSLRGPTAHPLAPGTRRFLPYRVSLISLSLRVCFLCVVRWNALYSLAGHAWPLLANIRHTSRVDDFIIVVR